MLIVLILTTIRFIQDMSMLQKEESLVILQTVLFGQLWPTVTDKRTKNAIAANEVQKHSCEPVKLGVVHGKMAPTLGVGPEKP